MLRDVVELFSPRPGDVYADCTAGLGGHAAEVAQRLSPGGTVVLNDVDEGNLRDAANRVREAAPDVRIVPIRGNFALLPRRMEEQGLRANLVLADLGFSSNQVDDPSRGLSFGKDGPLDMRLDRSLPATAAELIASLPEAELERIIADFGEERQARRVARKLVQARAAGPISTTAQLAALVRAAVGPAGAGIDPATRTFQALRIAVNDELGSLEALLAAVRRDAEAVAAGGSGAWLAGGARVGVISFHSLEDRPVKQVFRDVVRLGGRDVSNGPALAGGSEVAANPRARSAKLRVVSMPGV